MSDQKTMVLLVPPAVLDIVNGVCAAIGIDDAVPPKTIRDRTVDGNGDPADYCRVVTASSRIRDMLAAAGPTRCAFTDAVRDGDGNLMTPEAFIDIADDPGFLPALPDDLDPAAMGTDAATVLAAFEQVTVCFFDWKVDHLTYRKKFLDHLELSLKPETV